jgi:uncharacterized cupredoxin-like copper-binding protein
MTAAAARTAEMFAEEILAGALTLQPVNAACLEASPMNRNSKARKITLHDMTLRDGMHPKRHQMSLEQMKVHRQRPGRRRRAADRSHPRRRPGRRSVNYGFPAHTDEEYLAPSSR